jgi:hypothetical protein
MGFHKDEIIDEIRMIRQAHAAKFNFDLDRIFQNLSRKEKALKGFKIVSQVVRRRPSNSKH